jgi:hypothetical protein
MTTQNLSLTEPSANELFDCAERTGPSDMSPDLRREIMAGITPTEPPVEPPVTTPPSGEMPTIPDSIPPFDRVLKLNWVWGQVPPQADTYVYPGGPMGPHGILVCAFVPQLVEPIMSGLISLGVFPGNMHACERSISISPIAGDFSQPFPLTVFGDNVSMYFQVGGSTRTHACLTPGQPYFINVANVRPDGTWTTREDAKNIEFRFHIAPPYHY